MEESEELKAFYPDRKAISPWIAVAVIALVIFAGLASYWLGLQIFGVTPGEDADTGVFVGTLAITVQESNLLDPSTTPTTTSDSYIIYHSRGKLLDDIAETDLIGGTTFTVGTAANFGVSAEDEGVIFMYADPGTDYFLAHIDTYNNNQGFTDWRTMDTDGDNRDEYIFEIDVSDFDSSLDTNTKQINVVVVQEDTSIALNSPADQDSIGTGTKTGTIEWQITGIAEKYGGRLARVYVVSNDTTFESQTAVTSVSIAGIGTFDGTDINPVSGDKTWYVDIGVNDYRELVDTHLLTRESGGSSYVGVTVSWETYFTAATDATTVTLYVTIMGADESLDTADNDACVLGG